MILNCVPITAHLYCEECKSYFSKTNGDAIRPMDLIICCPYCNNKQIIRAEASKLKETISRIKNKLKRL